MIALTSAGRLVIKAAFAFIRRSEATRRARRLELDRKKRASAYVLEVSRRDTVL